MANSWSILTWIQTTVKIWVSLWLCNLKKSLSDSEYLSTTSNKPEALPVEVELEDTIGEEDTQPCTFSKFVEIDGKLLNKAWALAVYQKYRHQPSSTDCLKQVQAAPRYCDVGNGAKIAERDSVFRGPCLIISEPVVTLICCEMYLFLCVAEVTAIHFGYQALQQIELNCLSEKTVQISFQVMKLICSTENNNLTLEHDWCSITQSNPLRFKTLGHLVQPINLNVVVPQQTGTSLPKPFYIFSSKVLMAFVVTLALQLQDGDIEFLPQMKTTTSGFPYCETSGRSSKVFSKIILNIMQAKLASWWILMEDLNHLTKLVLVPAVPKLRSIFKTARKFWPMSALTLSTIHNT